MYNKHVREIAVSARCWEMMIVG